MLVAVYVGISMITNGDDVRIPIVIDIGDVHRRRPSLQGRGS